MLDSCKQLAEAQAINGELKLQNARLQQKLTEVKEHVVGLERRLSELKSQNRAQQDQKDAQDVLSQSQKVCRSLEKELVKERMNCYRVELEQKHKILEMSQKYDRQLRDMRACLGFLFGRVEM
jgi:chromosome segregation ATPase